MEKKITLNFLLSTSDFLHTTFISLILFNNMYPQKREEKYRQEKWTDFPTHTRKLGTPTQLLFRCEKCVKWNLCRAIWDVSEKSRSLRAHERRATERKRTTANSNNKLSTEKHTDGGGERWYEKLISLLLIPYWTFVLRKPNQTDSHFSLLVVSSLNHSHTVLAACQSSCCCWFNRQENRVNERREKNGKGRERRQKAHDRFDRDINFDDTISSLFFFG